MKFTVIVNTPPDSLAADSAFRFCKALLSKQHSLYRVFFYSEGVMNGATRAAPALSRSWSDWITENQIDAVCCVGSAQSRNLKSEEDLLEGFTLSGLGQLVDGLANSDRVITFGKRAAFA